MRYWLAGEKPYSPSARENVVSPYRIARKSAPAPNTSDRNLPLRTVATPFVTETTAFSPGIEASMSKRTPSVAPADGGVRAQTRERITPRTNCLSFGRFDTSTETFE